MPEGQITKSISGQYDVKANGVKYVCKPRGVFRIGDITPLVGDYVRFELDENQSGTITEIFPRKNCLVRPPLANLDVVVMVVSAIDPVPNFPVADKFLATMASHDIPCIIAVTKTDLASPDEVNEIYSKAGYEVFAINNTTGAGVATLKEALVGKLSAFAGNTGVGKSSLLNSIDHSLSLATGETSQKLGRGKHTTRHVEIFSVSDNINIADTPGFSSMDLTQTTDLLPETLASCFTDFTEFAAGCKFNNCRHLSEIGCAVKKAVEENEIHPSRYKSYTVIFNEIKDLKEWHRR